MKYGETFYGSYMLHLENPWDQNFQIRENVLGTGAPDSHCYCMW